ncbi:replication initiator protein A [Streptococcus pneumoniae]|uniref:replication initiator protein A n=3 Tax=Streptococcus pneumoniae TaxID=1313 RepID=UPI000B58BB81|nr:replication initiator protein A [Streptococcus pneumoniae]SND96838.1 replication initiator protein A [Streptococcus pneumoniae]HEU5553378.1 replication initiator protein A [Streptococcus pneumoniae]
MKRITANQYQTSERYYKLPKILFEDEKYMDMKLEVKVAYSILKDRLELSLSRGWIDEEGAVYLVFSNSKLMKLLGCSKSKLLSIKKILKEYDLIDEVQQSSSEKGRLANKIYLGELSSTPVASSNRPSVKKRLGQVENETAPVSYSAPSETEVSETEVSETEISETEISETESLFIEDEEDRNTQPILKRKVEKVTKYDRDYIWGLVQDQFRREGFSETASEIAMTDFERIYQYALDNVRFVRRAEVLAEFVFNGLYSVWNNRVRKGGG